MRIFGNYLEASKEVERDLWELGAICKTKSVQDEIKEVETRELVGYQFCIPTLGSIMELPEFFKISSQEFREYVEVETNDRWTGVPNPGNSWRSREGFWERYLHEGRFSYTYGERCWDPTNQFGHCRQVLDNDPNSRQAIIQIYNQSKDWLNTGGRSRIPCSLTYQYLSRASDIKRTLHCIYTMRSCDFYKHFVYDMVIAGRLNNMMARDLGWEPGNLIMQIGSLHAFREDLDKRKIF